MSNPPPITSFHGEYRFLSNFYPSEVELEGEKYNTVEHAYQAAKTESRASQKAIQAAATPGRAKRLGQIAKIRPDWEDIKEGVMLGLLRQKFSTGDLRGLLLDTENREIIEGNNWGDTYWGVCRGKGLNRLGILLMQVREEIRA